MIRYDWNILGKLSLDKIFDIMYLLEERTPMEYVIKIYLVPISKFKDTSAFLKNPMGLLYHRPKHTNGEIYLYLELAALRSYFNYKETGSLRLPTYYIKGKYNLNQIKLNSALIVTNEEIIFKYEEI